MTRLLTLACLILLWLPNASRAASSPSTLTALIVPATANRPTYRTTQAKGRQDKQRKMPVIAVKPPREYRDLINGMRMEYPNEWSYTYSAQDPGSSAPRYDWTIFGGSTVSRYTNLAIGTLYWKKPVTAADLAKDFADYSREPKYEEEFRNPRFMLMFELLRSEQSSWNGRPILISTFTHRYQSRNTMVRQIRIPAGNRIIVLEYSADQERFDRDLHFFEDFRKSFALL